MPRKKHIWYNGAILHVTARGNHRSDIFKDETDYKLYVNYSPPKRWELLGQYY